MIVFRIMILIIMMGSLYGFHFHSGSAVIQSVSHYPRFVAVKPAQLKSLSQIMTREISSIVKIVLYAPASRKLIVFSHPVVALLVMISVPEIVLWLPRRFGYLG